MGHKTQRKPHRVRKARPLKGFRDGPGPMLAQPEPTPYVLDGHPATEGDVARRIANDLEAGQPPWSDPSGAKAWDKLTDTVGEAKAEADVSAITVRETGKTGPELDALLDTDPEPDTRNPNPPGLPGDSEA